MRILPFEQKAIHEAIGKAGLELTDFRFVKRQGKLHIFYKDKQEFFKYFRKKETKLVDGKWEDRMYYVLYPNGNEQVVDEWQDVFNAFETWLSQFLPT